MATPSDVRGLFENRLKETPTKFHSDDVENRVNNDNYIKRILQHQNNDIKLSADMLWDICVWRKTVKANEINENNVNIEYLKEGAIFTHGRDIEGSLLLIFKSKQHVKGQKDFEELKRCVIYWFERAEREENGSPISLFFDMDGCGLSNMDMEFTKYLITLMKLYYPLFLRYIIIYHMPWVLSAAFKVIKQLLPAEAVSRMKFLSKETLKEVVAPEQALVCWGGKDEYEFQFVSESRPEHPQKKVTFADGDTMGHSPGELLHIVPYDTITFCYENDELCSSFVIKNMDESPLAFKIRTTSPEKFRVRSSLGTLAVGASQTIIIIVQPDFQHKAMAKDRFLVSAVQISNPNLSTKELTEIWQKSTGSKVDDYRIKCHFPDKDTPKIMSEVKDDKTKSINSVLNELSANCKKLNGQIRTLKIFQLLTLALSFTSVILGFFLYVNTNSI